MPSSGWAVAPGGRSTPAALVGGVLLVIGFLVFVFGSVFGDSGLVIAAVLGFIFIVVGIALLAIGGATRRRAIPPPPPIQQPPGQRTPGGAAEIACPNCGAPPGQVDRFGIATCNYCGTRFLVR